MYKSDKMTKGKNDREIIPDIADMIAHSSKVLCIDIGSFDAA